MENETKCREWILSEEYRDFIINDNRTPFFENIAQNPVCEQYAGSATAVSTCPGSRQSP